MKQRNKKPFNFESRGRLIEFDGVRYRYQVGEEFVTAYSETGDKYVSPCYIVKGVLPDEFLRGKYKITSSGMIQPSDVKRWLQTKIAKQS